VVAALKVVYDEANDIGLVLMEKLGEK